MEHQALGELRRQEMQRRLSFLSSVVDDAAYELWRGELSLPQAEKLTLEVRSVRAEMRTLRTKLALGAAGMMG